MEMVCNYKQICFFIGPIATIKLNEKNIRERCLANLINRCGIGHSENIDRAIELLKVEGLLDRVEYNKENNCIVCPIFKNIKPFILKAWQKAGSIDENIREISDLWNISRRGILVRVQQTNFLEMISLQFLIIYVSSAQNGGIRGNLIDLIPETSSLRILWEILIDYANIAILLAIFFAIPVILTNMFVGSKPMRVYENRWLRLILISLCWLCVMFILYIVG